MDRIVSNASPLIYLAKANQLSILQSVVQEVFIPQGVFQEVVVKGKHLGEKDAYRIDKAVREGWILVKTVRNLFPANIPVHAGEAEVISLAKETAIEIVLMDDAKARIASELAGLKPIGTLGILLGAVKNRKLNFEEFLTTLEDIVRTGFYLKEDVYLRVVQEARRLSGG
jgi:predicted nucleic acid-binding protein